MKYLVFSDNHFCRHSSIIRGRGEKYSKRLENQIQSLNWVNNLAYHLKLSKVDKVICLGDFFDSSSLNAEELTALKDIEWATGITRFNFLVGNHEMWKNDLSCSSSHLFRLIPNAEVIDTPHILGKVGYLPYIPEANRRPLKEYFPEKMDILFSHNDIAGIDYGGIKSTFGFSIDEIEECCDLFVNGHIHNGSFVTDKIINLGNLTGLNFSEDAFKYPHRAMLIETFPTSKPRIEFFENPFAFNFYKLNTVEEILKPNSVVTVRCKEQEVGMVRSWIKSESHIIESRIIVDYSKDESVEPDKSFSIDYREEFKNFINSNVGTSSIVNYEVEKVLADEN